MELTPKGTPNGKERFVISYISCCTGSCIFWYTLLDQILKRRQTIH